jgi:acetyltransferase-like isoleucine patch superfamily enzyme
LEKKTRLPEIFVTWPHKVSIGKHCRLEHHVYFHHDGIWSAGYSIGEGCAIASECRFIDHNHTDLLKRLPDEKGKEIILEAYVWVGCNAVILEGVTIGKGAVVAAGAVVAKSIPPREVWGGVPARKIGERK